MTKKPLALITALMAGTLALPAVAQQAQQNQQQGMQTQQQDMQPAGQQQGRGSLRVGHNVVDAVDDVRETIGDLVASLGQSGESMGMQPNESRLQQMEQELEQMEQTLDEKAERTDEGWLSWIRGEDYKVTVTEQVNTLARNLDELSTMLSSAQGQNMQQIISVDVVNQVEDVRETVGDLINALQDAEELNVDEQRLQQAQQRLDTMEQELDRHAEMEEEEWGTYATGQEFTPGIQKNISELSQILQSLFQQG